jgi:hypothetical protein
MLRESKAFVIVHRHKQSRGKLLYETRVQHIYSFKWPTFTTRSLNLGTHVHIHVHALVSGTMLRSSCTTLAVSQYNKYNSWAHAWWCTMPILCPHFHILHACSDSPLPTCWCFGPLARGWLCFCHGHLAGARRRGWGAAGACLSPACCCAAANIRRVTHRGKKADFWFLQQASQKPHLAFRSFFYG